MINNKKNIDFSSNLQMYGDDLPAHLDIKTGDVIDVLLDTVIKYPNVVKDVHKIIEKLMHPADVQTECSQYDILLWFNNKIVLCYEDNDFHEEEIKVAKPITKALKDYYNGSVSPDTIRILKLKEKLKARDINSKMYQLLNTSDSGVFIKILNDLDFEVSKELNIRVQGED